MGNSVVDVNLLYERQTERCGFPVPVCASATTSLFSPKRYGITSSCTGMGHAYPISSMARRISGDTPSSSNVFIKSFVYLYISDAKIVLFNGYLIIDG